MRWLPTLPVFLLAACMGNPMPDAHVPPFAKVPYEPFSRDAVVAIALREWRLFGQNVADPQADATRARAEALARDAQAVYLANAPPTRRYQDELRRIEIWLRSPDVRSRPLAPSPGGGAGEPW